MQIVNITTTNPYMNLAAEEYFLKQKSEDFFLLWQNETCIVVGRNQNTHAEINPDYVAEHHLPVVRRLTGGGAVFHDLGNLNYTFIQQSAEDLFGNYHVFARPVIETLATMGVIATVSGRNDLLIGDKKFCGNAQTMWRGRMMHHGCMLFSADVSGLADALRVNPLKIQSKGIASVRSRVTNICDHTDKEYTVDDFRNRLLERFLSDESNEWYTMTDDDVQAIQTLCQQKYATKEWNYGFRKAFTFQKDTLLPAGLVTCSMNIREDTIQSIAIEGDFFGVDDIAELEEQLVGQPYDREQLLHLVETLDVSRFMAGVSPQELITTLF